MKMIRGLVLAVLVAAGPQVAVSQRVGEVVPTAFRLESIDGRVVDFGDHDGAVRIVNVWASWCRPCVLELPSLAAMADSLAADGVQVFAVAVDRPENVRRFLRRVSDVPSVWFEKDPLPRQWGRWAMPTTWVIGADGRLLHVHYGAARWDDRRVLADLRRLMDADVKGVAR